MNQPSMHKSTMKQLRSLVFKIGFFVLSTCVFIYPFIFPPETPLERTSLIPSIGVPDFAAIDNVSAKKRAFFNYLLPEIVKQNELVMQERLFLMTLQKKLQQKISLTESHLQTLRELAEKYRVDESADTTNMLKQLIKRVDIIPPELVLVQAANESAWGTSRFAQQGYNFFGLWCFKQGCGFVPARRTEGSAHEVAKFGDLSQAVNTYIRNLNRHYAYEELRNIRQALRENHQPIKAEALVQGLMSYSERGQDYIDELLNMISYNKKYMNI